MKQYKNIQLVKKKIIIRKPKNIKPNLPQILLCALLNSLFEISK